MRSPFRTKAIVGFLLPRIIFYPLFDPLTVSENFSHGLFTIFSVHPSEILPLSLFGSARYP